MKVQDIMSSPVTSVTVDTPVSKVASLLHDNRFTGVPVVNDEGRVLGMITEREFFSKDFKLHLPTYIALLGETDFILGGGKQLPYVAEQITRIKAKDVMNKKVIFLSPDESVEKASEVFARTGQNPIPVTDHANILLGIISRSDFIKLFSNTKVENSPAQSERPVDTQFAYVEKDVTSRFALVAKARANIWVTTATVLLIVGFIAGIVFAANPDLLKGKKETLPPNPSYIPYTP